MGWIANAFFHSLLCFFIPFLVYFAGGMALPAGVTLDHDNLSNTIYTNVIIIVSLKVLIESGSWTMLHHMAVWLSILSYFATLSIYTVMWPAMEGIFKDGQGIGTPDIRTIFRTSWFQFFNATSHWLFWFSIALTIAIVLAKDILWKSIIHNVPKLRALYHDVQDLEFLRVKVDHELALHGINKCKFAIVRLLPFQLITTLNHQHVLLKRQSL